MDLRTIKTFKTIVKYGSFQRAAEELKYAQSTVTTQIKNLESALGVTLLERGKNLQLTEAGKLLNEKGDLLLKGFENLQSAMEDLVNGESGIIRIGVMEPTASFRLPQILPPFREKFPKIQMSIQIHSVKILSEMIKKDEVDVAICTAPEQALGTIFEPIFTEEVALLTPSSHYLSRKETICLKDIENEQLLATSSFCPFRKNLEKQLIENGINPNYGIEVSNMLALKHFVQTDFGIAVVPVIAITPLLEGTVMKQITDFDKGLTVGIMRSEERSYQGKAMEYLLELLHQGLKKPVNSLTE